MRRASGGARRPVIIIGRILDLHNNTQFEAGCRAGLEVSLSSLTKDVSLAPGDMSSGTRTIQ